jgi:hypothetical protein
MNQGREALEAAGTSRHRGLGAGDTRATSPGNVLNSPQLTRPGACAVILGTISLHHESAAGEARAPPGEVLAKELHRPTSPPLTEAPPRRILLVHGLALSSPFASSPCR